MGFFSKEPIAHQKGDQQVNVATSLETHTDFHESHTIKLWVLIAVAICVLLVLIGRIIKKNIKGQVVRAARSAATIATLETA